MKNIPIDIRSKKLRGGRLNISSGTGNQKLANAREQVLRGLIEDGELGIIERLRDGEIGIAQVYEAARKGNLEQLRGTSQADVTLAAMIDRLKRRIEGGGVEGTILHRNYLAGQFLAHFCNDAENRRIVDITSDECERFIYGPKKNGNPWGAVRQEQARQMGVTLWDLAIATDHEEAQRNNSKPRITVNPWRNIIVKGAGSRAVVRVHFLTTQQWATLENENRDLPELALCALGALAGLREGEAVNLRPGIDVDLEKRLIHIQPRKGQFKWKPKTPRSVRTVPINDRLLSILQRHVELGFAGEKYLIRAPRKEMPLRLGTAQQWTRRAFLRAGITYGRASDGFTNHTLRHTFASWLAQEDVQLLKIAALLGDTIETVARFYAHLLPTDHERTVRVLDRKLAP